MRAVILIVALAVITGCNARAVSQPDASPNWENTVNRFWRYIADLNTQGDGVMQSLKVSHFSRELDTLITDTMAELTTYRDDIQNKLSPYTDSTTSQMSQDLQLLANRLQKDMLDAKERSVGYLGEVKAMVAQNNDDIQQRISTYTTKLRKRLNKDTEEIRTGISTYLGEIQSRASQNLDAARVKFEPYIDEASDSTMKKLGDLSTIMKDQTEGLGQQLEIQAEGLRTQLEAAAEELRTSLDGKFQELTKVLTPLADQIREKFEDIVEKVKGPE
ncbi:apolipoprotein Eb [Brachionichthys hirsutus]|uniref:apolipoprotein Eb n=1 Tax=Brachionichthys hirsutus TaxID=412623 RepID=UPI003605445C